MDTLRLQISGMTCAACSSRIEKGLQRLDGVQAAAVNLATAQAIVRYDRRKVGDDGIRSKIEQLGYGASAAITAPHETHEAEIRSLRARFAVSFLMSLPLFWAMLSHIPLLDRLWIPETLLSPLLQWGLATVLQFYVGYPFYRGAYLALKQRSANMDSLVALSTSVAYFYSHYLLLQARLEIAHDQLYFDTIAMVLTVILLGKLLEAKAKGRALKDLNELYGLQIRLVRVRKGQGEEWIPAERLRKGEEVIVEAGEWISADGKIIAGSAEADEALLTGESAPALKSVGDDVYSGTRCLNGALRIRASCDASGTRLSRMIAMVENAQSVKPTLARKVDKAAAVFVPIMVLCAALTYAYWSWGAEGASAELAIRHSLSVLLIACPCALGLAAPVSILIATALAAKKGILFKDGGAMETLAKVDRLLFDKTGTLTEGKPRLKAIQTTRYSKAYLLRMVAAVERQSAHLLAEAIMETAERQGIVVPDAAGTMEIPGGGVQGLVEGKQVRVGHRQWIASAAGEAPDTDANFGELSADGAATVLYVTIEGRHSGALLLSDTLRSEAAEVMAKLKPAAKLSIVTGDQPSPAYAIARQAGIEEVRAGCSPERKAAVVEEERQGGHIVAFVGDGNNDAAALAAADVGIAMGGGAGAAMQVGDIVLARNRLSGIADAFRLSKAALKNIKQNIAFAIVYNTAAVPLAAAGYLDPKIACLGMAASSVLVVSNALRLQSVALAERGRE